MYKTREGERLAENQRQYIILDQKDYMVEEQPPIIPPKKPRKSNLDQLRVEFFIHEITALRERSIEVVADCDKIIALYTTKEEYLHSDVKVAKMIHTRLIDKYTRLLNWESAL